MNYKEINNKILITDEEGIKKEYEIIAYIDVNKKRFLVYTDGKEFKNGEVALYINSVIEKENGLSLEDVTEEELNLVIEELKKRLVI